MVLSSTEEPVHEEEFIRNWLQDAGLQKYSDVLFDHRITSIEALLKLELEDLSRLGIKALGARRKFLTALNVLRSQRYTTISNAAYVDAVQSPGMLPKIANSKQRGGGGGAGITATSPLSSSVLSNASGAAGDRSIQVELERSLCRESVYKAENEKMQREIAALCAEARAREDEMTKLKEEVRRLTADKEALLQRERQKDDRIQFLGQRIKDVQCPVCMIKPYANVDVGGDDIQPDPDIAAAVAAGKEVSDEALSKMIISREGLSSIFNHLEKENADLEVIKDSADHLLTFEREDSPESKIAEVTVRRRSMEVDVEMFKGIIQGRLDKMENKEPPKYNLHKMGKGGTLDYTAMLREQRDQLKELEGSRQKYDAWLERSLIEIKKKNDMHFSIGEFRDKTELRLKTQLGKLIGQPGTDNPALEKEIDVKVSAARGAQFKQANEILHQKLEEFLKRVDVSKDGLMQTQELIDAVNQDSGLWEELHVLAINLAFCPENRLQTDSKEYNQFIQDALDSIMLSADPNSDGVLSTEEIKNIPAGTKKLLRKLGIDIQI